MNPALYTLAAIILPAALGAALITIIRTVAPALPKIGRALQGRGW